MNNLLNRVQTLVVFSAMNPTKATNSVLKSNGLGMTFLDLDEMMLSINIYS